MKRYLPMALSLFLCHCGTEVGNGIAPEPKTTATTEGTNAESPTAGGAAPDNKSPTGMPLSFISTSFLAACASPFAEAIDGSFTNDASSTGFIVAATADARKTITVLNSTSVLYTIKTAPQVSSYAIEALSDSPSVTCSAVTSQTLVDGSLQRSVTLSNGDLVQWTLTTGKVSSMKLTRQATIVESWTKK